MSLWKRLLGGRGAKPPAESRASEEPDTPLREAESASNAQPHPILALGSDGGPSEAEALKLVESLRNDVDAGTHLAALLSTEPHSIGPRVRLALAELLRERGEFSSARRLVGHSNTPEALLLRADLAAEAGDLDGALSLIERLLGIRIDYPGAIDRHRRWAKALGRGGTPRTTSDGMTLLTPSNETPFVLLREVARGGAGVVYEARDRKLERRVALKFYHEPRKQGEQLLREIRISSALRSRYVVRVFDADPDAGWIAMEWASGGSLRNESVGSQPPERLARWIVPVTEALAFVHAAGFVHLDIKPANILRLESHAIVLSDFGLAHPIGETADGGSFGFVSPDRLRGKFAEPRDDLYGLGRMIEDAISSACDEERDALLVAWGPFAERCLRGDFLDARHALQSLRRETDLRANGPL